MDVLMNGRGQSAASMDMSFDDFNPNERAVIESLGRAGEPIKIRDIIAANGWESLGKSTKGESRGSSRVRNSLRRPVRAGWVEHTKQVGDGKYRLTSRARNSLGDSIKATIVNPAASDPCVVEMGKNPKPITRAQAQTFAVTDGSVSLKRDSCAFYNACLDQAISGNWPGFSCESCSAFAEPDQHQKEMNRVRLVCLDKVAEIIEKEGSISRKVGVKEGSTRRASALG